MTTLKMLCRLDIRCTMEVLQHRPYGGDGDSATNIIRIIDKDACVECYVCILVEMYM